MAGTDRQTLSRDTVALMQFQNSSKSTAVAYLLFFFLGGLGIHRFYLGKNGTGFIILVCTISGLLLVFPLIVTGIFMVIDLFTIPSQVRAFNGDVMQRIQSGGGN